MKKLQVKKKTVASLLARTTEKAVGFVERLKQKKEKFLTTAPIIKHIVAKVRAFDQKMTEKHGIVYTKIRDSIKNTARTVLAAQLFGIPGVIGICAYKTGEKLHSILAPAYRAKKEGRTDSMFKYIKENKEEALFTLTSGALSIASAAAKVAGAAVVVAGVRIAKASLLAAPEAQHLIKSTANWLTRKGTFKEVRRDAAVLGITIATYFAGGVPMTRGKGKPIVDKQEKDDKYGTLEGTMQNTWLRTKPADGKKGKNDVPPIPPTPPAPPAAGARATEEKPVSAPLPASAAKTAQAPAAEKLSTAQRLQRKGSVKDRKKQPSPAVRQAIARAATR